MRILKIIVPLGFIIILLSACEISKTIDIDIPFGGSKIVVIGMIGDSSLHPVFVAKTSPPLSNELDSISLPEILLLENGSIVGQLTKCNDYLYSLDESVDFIPNIDGIYSIIVRVDGFDEVTSLPISFPILVEIDSLTLTPASTSSVALDLNVFFSDPLEDNYYAIRIITYADGELVDGMDSNMVFSPYSVFDDALFQGQLANKTLKVKIVKEFVADSLVTKDMTYVVTLFSIPKSTFDFYWSIREQSSSLQNFYMEPTIINSSIVGGYGHFGVYLSSEQWISYKGNKK